MPDNSTSPTELQSGGFWSGEKLLENKSVITDFNEAHVDANAYNLRMGDTLFKTADISGKHQGKVTLKDREPFSIPPGQFAFLLTKEEVNIPSNTMAFISMRTRIKYQGLINVSGFHVDPGYKGKLIYAVYNASPSPVQLCEGDPAFKIWFCSLDRNSSEKFVFNKSGVYDIDNEIVRGMSREIYSLQAISEKFRDLEAKIDLKFAEQKPTVDGLKMAWDTITRGVVVSLLIGLLAVVVPIAWGIGNKLLPYILTWLPVQVERVVAPANPAGPNRKDEAASSRNPTE
ncbi:hypothetical protein ABMA32_03600 [Mesorhizobium sp. VNQ89]|uniref:dCTP deaminase domain-containing protein n=1 Tax=Mesorhizobium quangtriensis TaxID=3157709 RepID=UPI0032B70562